MKLTLHGAALLLAGVRSVATQGAPDPQKIFGATSSSLQEQRLVQLSADPRDTRWLSFEERQALKRNEMFYKDVTSYSQEQRFAWASDKLTADIAQHDYGSPRNSTLAHDAIATIDMSHGEKHLRWLTSLHTRWCETETGLQASMYLFNLLKSYVDTAPVGEHRLISLQPHFHDFKQFSMVVRIAGPNTTALDPVSITGAHIDSASLSGNLEVAPGADDDGSGTVTMLETARVLLGSRYTPAAGHAVEMHFYAGEEAGLLGSAAIAAKYKELGVRVAGMMQFDMLAWVSDSENEHIGITVSRNRDLSEFNKKLVDTYLSIPWVEESTYPWGASDSASWGDLGYPSSDALEGTWPETRSHKVHTTNDNMDHKEFSWPHIREAIKLAVAFHIELGGEA
ncbi:Zn-dependent exopeptidase [Auriculariales sp. MPI-PUGE-AT-0066]|nr:Zn-dependent exopeptidase [Auriculariales sp. MPI-PUGE-AT-0066]